MASRRTRRATGLAVAILGLTCAAALLHAALADRARPAAVAAARVVSRARKADSEPALRATGRPEGGSVDVSERARRPVGSQAPAARETVLDRMRRMRTCSSLQTLEAAGRSEPDARVRMAALQRIVDLRGEAARPYLLEIFADREQMLMPRREAAKLLARTGGDALSLLREIWHSDAAFPLRLGALEGMASVPRADVVEEMLVSAGSRASGERAAAEDILAGLEYPVQLAVLERVLEDPAAAPGARAAACRAFGRTRWTPATGLLARTVSDRRGAPEEVRAAAAEALGVLGDRSVLDRLYEAADPRPGLSAGLAHALRVAIQRLGVKTSSMR